MSKKTFSVDDILWAFLEHADDANRAVAVSVAGQPWGYVRIKGPSGQHQVIIERYNATVCLAEVHSALPGVERRPPDDPHVGIEKHPLGHSAGPSYGPFLYGISAEALRNKYATPSDFVSAIVQECTKTAVAW